MKLTCLQENLNKGLSIVGRAVATRTTLPMTNNVLLVTENERLKLVATNLELAISCWIPAKVEEAGAIAVPARLLTEFVGSLPADSVEMSISPKAKTMEVKCARYKANISGFEAKDFPPIPNVNEGIATRIKMDDLRQAIAHVVFAAATEESRPVLTGVDAHFEGELLTLAAADGLRLAVYKLPLANAVGQTVEVIVPAKSFAELNRMASEKDEEVEILVNPNKSHALFRLKSVEIVSSLVQGTFPKYEQLIPQSCTTKVEVDAQEFARATRTASIFARNGSGIVRVMAGDSKVTISAKSEEIGEDTGELDAKVDGDDAKIAFNGKYLMDVLGVLDQSRVVLEVTTPSSPGVIKPVGADNYIHVVMPMFVQW